MTNAEETFNQLARRLATERDDVTLSQMFGMPCLKVGGKAFAGYYKSCVIFKLSGEAHRRALAAPGASLFDPMGSGRAMKEWVQVPFDASTIWSTLAIGALEYVSARTKSKPATKPPSSAKRQASKTTARKKP